MMPRKLVKLSARIGVCLSLAAGAAHADVVTMTNGDRITGEVKRVWDGELFIDTDYADEFAVSLDQVARIESDREFDIELHDHSERSGRFNLSTDGESTFVSAEGSLPIRPMDIEELEEPEDYYDWNVMSDLSMNITRGNSETDNLLWQAAGNVKFGDHRHQLDLRYDRADQDSIRTKDQKSLNYIYSWFITDPWFLAAGVSYERDPIRGLTERYTPGLGFGYQFFEDANRLLEVTLAAARVEEKLAGASNDSLAARWQLFYRRDVTGDLEFFHDHSVLSYFDGRDNLVADTQTGIRWEVWSDVYFNVQLNWNWESDPAAGNQQEDVTYAVGFGLELD